jgi:hypothetical protein
MRKYVLAALIFLVPFGIGAYFVWQSKETVTEFRNSWLAARPIGPNHQSQPDDLHIPSGPSAALRLLLNDQRLQGNHLQGPARKVGDVLSDSDLAERPDLSSAAKGSQIYFYVVKEDAAPIVGWTDNASVIPCFLKAAVKPATKQETKCIHTPLRIIAIHKSRVTGEASWLALEIPEKLRCTFAEFALADKRILYQVNETAVTNQK